MSVTDYPSPDLASLRPGDILWPKDPNVSTLPTGEQIVDLHDLTGKLWALQAPMKKTEQVSPSSLDTLTPEQQAAADALLPFSTVSHDLGTSILENNSLNLTNWLEGFNLFPPTLFEDATFMGCYVGHVGMVDLHDDEFWVIESTYRFDGIRTVPYAEWRADRLDHGAHIWHGRIQKDGQDIATSDAQLMLNKAHALRMQGKHYGIFDKDDSGNFQSLGDETYVYCSELVYLCARTIGVDLDCRNILAKLQPFLGPRALTRSPFIKMLNQPGGQRY